LKLPHLWQPNSARPTRLIARVGIIRGRAGPARELPNSRTESRNRTAQAQEPAAARMERRAKPLRDIEKVLRNLMDG
jgi:hypothetical protein